MDSVTSPRISIRDVAAATGVSKSHVCDILRNRAGPSKETRERVLRAAKQLGYVPDARIASWMATVKRARNKDLLPIAWLNTEKEEDAWHKHRYFSPYFEGAQARARELGYHLDEIWTRQPGMTMRRVSQILSQRGIEGIIVAPPTKHVRLHWDHLAGVSLEGTLLAPGLYRVMANSSFNLLLALKSVRRCGYRRIGICLGEWVDRSSHHAIRSALYYFHSLLPGAEQITPLFYQPLAIEPQIKAWLRRSKPDVVIGLDNRLVQWIEAAGRRVPEQIGVVHLATDDDVSDWAGICSNKREMGAAAAEWVISLMKNRQFGIPRTAMEIFVRGRWHPGRTLLNPKPR